jgi:hypothetical protein
MKNWDYGMIAVVAVVVQMGLVLAGWMSANTFLMTGVLGLAVSIVRLVLRCRRGEPAIRWLKARR